MQESFKIPSATFHTLTGNIVTFNSQYAGLPLKSHTVDIDYTGSTISGTVVHFPSEFVGIYPLNDDSDTVDGIDYTINKNGLITLSGTSTNSITLYIDIKECVLPSDNGRTVYFNNDIVSSNVRIFFYNNSTNIDNWLLNVKNRTYTNYSALAGQTVNKIRIDISNATSVNGSFQIFFSVNNNDNTFNIAFPTPIYGGSYDCLTGLIYGTGAGIDLGSLTWTKEANHFYSNILTDAKYPPNNSTVAEISCEPYEVIAEGSVASEAVDNSIGLSRTGRIYIYDSSLSSGDATAFTTAVTGIKLGYKLANPTSTQTATANCETYLGQNNIWADTGDTTLQYIDLE